LKVVSVYVVIVISTSNISEMIYETFMHPQKLKLQIRNHTTALYLSVNYNRFSPTPADSVLSHRQPIDLVKPPKNVQAIASRKTRQPLNLKFKKAVSCRKILNRLKCIFELTR